MGGMPPSDEPDAQHNRKVPSIQGFKELFASASGIPEGATLLVSGPPGSGKTTFALALIRGLMSHASKLGANAKCPQKEQEEALVYYISSEVTEKALRSAYDSFGWFEQQKDNTEKPSKTKEEPFRFRIDDPAPDRTNFFPITPLPEVDRPVPSPEELVNSIFTRIANTLTPSETPRQNTKIYVIVDSITALLKGCANPGDERRQTHEIVHRLRDRFGPTNLSLTILLAEQDHRALESEIDRHSVTPTTPSVEDYLADIVFRLYVRSLPLGRRSRVLEVVKSQGVNMILGEHSWQIITQDTFQQILRHEGMQKSIKLACSENIFPERARRLQDIITAMLEILQKQIQSFASKQFPKSKKREITALLKQKSTQEGLEYACKEHFKCVMLAENTWPQALDEAGYCQRLLSTTKDLASIITEQDLIALLNKSFNSQSVIKCLWGGIILFPRPQLQRKYSFGAERSTSLEQLHLNPGTTGLEDVIITPGTTTLVAGPVGSGKTTLCKQFLKANPRYINIKKAITLTDLPPKPLLQPKPVLISFDIFPAGYEDRNIEILDFTQTKFDLNVLVSHIGWIFDGDSPPDKIGFDGLSEWITMFDEPEAARMLEVLMVTVLQTRRTPAVFMTYALELNDDPLGPHALGMNADNIIVVRQIAINDQLRRILYILKGGGGIREPETPRECILLHRENSDEPELVVVKDTLDYYTGLLGRSGDLKSANVLLQLFAENNSEQKLNKELYEAVKQQHESRLNITYTQFSRSEIGSTLDTAQNDHSPGESATLKVQSVDEWWLGSKKTTEFLRDIGNLWSMNPDLNESSTADIKLDEFSTNHRTVGWIDYWSFEVEKAISRTARGANESLSKIHKGEKSNRRKTTTKQELDVLQIHAVPNYMDFGMLCINERIWTAAKEALSRNEITSNGQSRKAETEREQRERLRKESRNNWVAIISQIPRQWVRHAVLKGKENINWFSLNLSETQHRSLLEFALYITGQNDFGILERKPVFTFDLGTRETCVCTFLEFAWAFGAKEEFLAVTSPEDIDRQVAAAQSAMTFLQFMVLEGLMPERGAIDNLNAGCNTLLIRHFYSTLVKTQESMINSKSQVNDNFIALPFMPLGIESSVEAYKSGFLDIATRLRYWIQRVDEIMALYHTDNPKSCKSAIAQVEDNKILALLLEIKRWQKNNATQSADDPSIGEAITCYDNCRSIVLILAGRGATQDRNRYPHHLTTVDDLVELTIWAALRLLLLMGTPTGMFPSFTRSVADGGHLENGMDEVRRFHQYLPDLKTLKIGRASFFL